MSEELGTNVKKTKSGWRRRSAIWCDRAFVGRCSSFEREWRDLCDWQTARYRTPCCNALALTVQKYWTVCVVKLGRSGSVTLWSALSRSSFSKFVT